jgi:hypothetical protein
MGATVVYIVRLGDESRREGDWRSLALKELLDT